MIKVKKYIGYILGSLKHKKVLIAIFVLFLSLIPTGALNNETRVQEVSIFASELVKSKARNQDYCTMIVEAKSQEDDITTDTFTAFSELYGVFGESKTNFVSAVNADKKETVYLSDCEDDINLSFLYVEHAGFYNREYNGVWRHQFYPLNLMFQGVHSYSDAFSFCYISQSQARKILNNRGIEYSQHECELLLGTKIEIIMNGKPFEWRIANIYFEDTSFYDAIHETIGDFLLGYNRFPEGFLKQSVFFMRQEVFQNTYLIKHSLSMYPQEKYNYSIGTFNLLDFDDDTNITIKQNSFANVMSIILVFFSLLFFLYLMVIIFKNCDYLLWDYIAFALIPFVPFSIFKPISFFTKQAVLFSSFSSLLFIIYLSIFQLFIAVLIIRLFWKGRAQ